MSTDTKSIGVAYRDQSIEGADNLLADQRLGFTSAGVSAVTQATNKATGVASSTPVTIVTMNGAAMNAATTVAFTLTNARITATGNILVSHTSAGTAGAYHVQACTLANGSAAIQVRNITAGSLSEAIVLTISIITS
jgi:hypothetical protein